MAKFRLKAGQLVMADRSKPLLDANNKPTGRFATKTYAQGDVIVTDKDLIKICGAEKVELLTDAAPADAAAPPAASDRLPANLDALTLKQLREVADAEEVDLGDAKTRDEVLRVLKGQAG